MNHPRHSLLRQFVVLTLIICMVVCLSFVAMLTYVNYSSLQSSTQVMNNLHQQMISRIDEYYRTIENAAYALCYSPTLQDYIKANSNEDRIGMALNLRSVHSGTYLVLDSLTGVATFSTTGEYIESSRESIFFLDGLPPEYTNVLGYHYTGVYHEGDVLNITRDSFAMLTPIYSLETMTRLLGRRIGTAVFSFDLDYLVSLIRAGTLSDEYITILTDTQGNLMAASSTNAESYYNERKWETHTPAASTTSTLSKSGWQLYSFMPQGIITSEMQPLLYMISIMGAVFLLLLILLILLLNRQIIRPIFNLSGFMARVPQDKRPVRFQASNDNELGEMIHVMNQIDVEADPAVMPYRTIKLLLQPIVENAVFHGLEKRVGPGHIKVTAKLDHAKLIFTVQDDGVGMDDTKLNALRESITEEQTDIKTTPTADRSIGLKNIARRLHLHYGENSCLTIESTQDKGTQVQVIISIEEGALSCTE